MAAPAGLKGRLKRRRALVRAVRAARAGLARIRFLAARPLRGITARRYLARHPVPALQLGCGTSRLPGWLNTDRDPVSFGVVPVDSTKPLPFPDRTFGYVFSEHHIEHVTFLQGRAMLRECRRVLRPGGRVRIATPDLDVLLALHRLPRSAAQEAYVRWVTETWLAEAGPCRDVLVINHAFRAWGHQFLYDEPTLREALAAAGFVRIVRHATGESGDDRLRGIESHGQAVGNVAMNRFETMVLEAERPE